MFETITREYQYLYFYVDGNKKIPVVSGATRDLSLVVFPHKGLVQKMVDDFNIKTDLFVWIDGTEFLIKSENISEKQNESKFPLNSNALGELGRQIINDWGR
ncbi:hypothetical protein [Leuconostoc pseudomesenteroides]|uniref:hypothetical protein n=1 Tax=Leuconostoc pseudomesenteroides TaxID=33968 RepID=UPI001F5214D1|nr:hypothetical protein [Leuconostoc pseudomesenteroides]